MLEIETDKAVGEIEATTDGVLKGVRVHDGESVPVGETIAYIAQPDEIVPLPPQLGAEVPSAAGKTATVVNTITSSTPNPEDLPSKDGPIRATPIARRVAKDLGVDLRKIKGTGPMGTRGKEEDVRSFVASLPSNAKPLPTVPVQSGDSLITLTVTEVGHTSQIVPIATEQTIVPGLPVDAPTLPLTQAQQITGQRMLESVRQAPHFSLQVSANMTAAQRLLENTRAGIERETGSRISITAILIKVTAVALKKHPRANSSFYGNVLRLYPDVNIGVAVGSDDGLIVPVIKNTDTKSLAEITQELKSFQAKAAKMRFDLDDLTGGTFTISNLGMYGVGSRLQQSLTRLRVASSPLVASSTRPLAWTTVRFLSNH